MFNLLGSKPDNQVKYQVFMTKIAKYRQLMNHVKDLLEMGQKVHLVAHFDQTMDELQQLITRAGLEFSTDTGQPTSSLVLSKSDILKSRGQMLAEEHQMILAEIHPTAIREESIAKLLAKEMTIFCALDNPFFEMLGGERIRQLMRKLGLDENLSIEHPMVTKSIIAAQKKMDKKAEKAKPAASMREWMALNVKSE